MLDHVWCRIRPEGISKSAEAITGELLGLLVRLGFLAGKGAVVHANRVSGILTLSGTTTGPRAIEESMDRADLTPLWDQLRGVSTGDIDVEVGERSGSEGSGYLDASGLGPLELVCDVLLAVSPLISADTGAYVGLYRLSLDDGLRERLWTWDNQYRALYELWLAGGSYEDLAERELRHASSELNLEAADLAVDIGRSLGVAVTYQIMSD